MELNQPYYIEPRKNSIDLGGEWSFLWQDTEEYPKVSDFKYKTTLPKSVFHSLCEAGVLPDPYVGTNSKEYSWVDEKIWYYRKTFTLNEEGTEKNAFLCFDGVAYYSKVWVNSHLLGEHEGMFGGPVCEVSDILNYNGENEIIVEVKACNFGVKDTFDPWNHKGENSQIVPWNIARDKFTSNGDFIVLGIWNRIRLEITNKHHISRPYLYTKSISDDYAELFLELEIADGGLEEIKPYYGYISNGYVTAFNNGLTGKKLDENVDIHIKIKEPDTENVVYDETETVGLTDFKNSLIVEKFYELQFYSKTIRIKNPKLWYPLGMGDAYLYDVEIELIYNGRTCDKHEFKTGIRLLERTRTTGGKYRTRWEDFKFSINGKSFFLMGINWMPVDFLYDIPKSEYDWCLALAKNAGVQMLRVWNGGGFFETDYFYELCDKYGIMVWQDHLLANVSFTQNFDQEILESQVAYNIYRIRNHASLVIHCGGNEFAPYTIENAASMFILTRVAKDLDPSRIFYYTTPDCGSAHVYRNFEPVWFRHIYKELPFMGEAGVHSFPTFRSLKKLLSEKECMSKLPDIASKDFSDNYPELLNHFTEYKPDRVPTLLARSSQISDLSDITLADLCENAQVQAYEFYTVMIQAMRENYPVCGGILPWTFKRPWTTVGIQTVDGSGRPTLQYYAVLNTFKPLHIALLLDWTIIAPHEAIAIKTKIFNQNNDDLTGANVNVTVYNPDMSVNCEKTLKAEEVCEFDEFIPDDSFTDKCFIISVNIEKDKKIMAESTYFIKCTSMLSDSKLYKKYRTEPLENFYFEKGPWLKQDLQAAQKAVLEARLINCGMEGKHHFYDIMIKNTSSVSAYPVMIDVEDDDVRFFADENFFLLKPDALKQVRIISDKNTDKRITVRAYNSDKTILHIS